MQLNSNGKYAVLNVESASAAYPKDKETFDNAPRADAYYRRTSEVASAVKDLIKLFEGGNDISDDNLTDTKRQIDLARRERLDSTGVSYGHEICDAADRVILHMWANRKNATTQSLDEAVERSKNPPIRKHRIADLAA